MSLLLVPLLFLGAFTSPPSTAEQPSSEEYYIELDREIQTLKAEFLELNRDLSLLEEEVLYPSDQQLLVFVSMANSTQVSPSSVSIELDGNILVDHDYTQSEVEALKRGGVQRLYIGTIEAGDHVLKASLAVTAENRGQFQRMATTDFSRWRGPTYVELRIEGTGSTEGPEFRVDLW